MRWLVALFSITFFISSYSHSAACPASTSAESSGASDGSNCTVTGSQATIQLNFISGFTDTTATTATGGNNGTTVGAQRKLSFIKAAEVMADQVASTQIIIIDATFSALACDAVSATLGSAGASVSSYHPTPPAGLDANTWYPVGLFNDKANSDTFSPTDDANGPDGVPGGLPGFTGNDTGSDINANFNSDLGDSDCLNGSYWHYGYDAPSGSDIGFVTVLLHEMLHGYGFASLVHPYDGTKTSNLNDAFSNNLYDLNNSQAFNSASDAERADAVVSVTGLTWSGSNVNANAIGILTDGFYDSGSDGGNFANGDMVEMYAPCATAPNSAQYDYSPGNCLYESGSSISHFNTDASPNELMEPQYTEGTLNIGLALYLLQDIGWNISTPVNTDPTITAVNQTTDEDVAIENVNASGWASDSDGDSLTFSITSCPSDLTCAISSDGSDLDITPDANYNGATNTITIEVNDGNGGTASDNFNVTVNTVDDAPTWSAIPDQTVTEGGSSVAINLASYVSDVDGDSITGYSVVSCGTGLDCSNLSGSTLTLSATSNGGATVSVTVRADEGDLTTDTNFNVIINTTASPTPPPLELNNTPLDASTPVAINNDEVSLSLTDGVTGYNISLTFEGQAANSLLSYSGTEINIAVPDASFLSGQFAGDYVLTLQHIASGNNTQFTFTRAPRLKTSASKLMGATDTQTLIIEGGAAGTVYSLSNNSGDIAFAQSSSAVTSTTATTNSAAFNPATVTLDVAAVTGVSNSTISVSSIYDTATSSLDIYPKVMYELTVEDTSANRLTSATAAVQSTSVTDFNLPSTFTSNQLGVIVLSLPNIGSDIVVRVSQDLYTAKDVTLDASQLTQTVILDAITNPLTIIGNIEASAPLDFQQSLPTVTLTLTDGSEIDIPVTKTSNSLAQFEYVHDLNTGSISNLIIDHSNGVRLTLDVINSPGSITYNIFLESSAPSPAGDTSIGSGGGALGLTALLLLLLNLFRLYPRKAG
jgi:hypothetical protein